MTSDESFDEFTATPAGMARAARDGDVDRIEWIAGKSPELVAADNPYNWSKTAQRHTVRGASNAKPVEVAAFYRRPAAVTRLIELARQSNETQSPIRPYFQSLEVASAMRFDDVVRAIERAMIEHVDERPESIHAADSSGTTLLHYVASHGQLPLIELLLDRGAPVDRARNNGFRPIHAVLDGPHDPARVDAARLLLDRGARTDLWIATALGDVGGVREMLLKVRTGGNKHFRPDRPDYSDGFPLVRACALGNRELVEVLLENGADVNAKLHCREPAEFGMPIVAALYGSHLEIVHLLLDRGASVHAHPNSAASFADMAYEASVSDRPCWLALGELCHVSSDPRGAIQPHVGPRRDFESLYQRVASLGGTPDLYCYVRQRDYNRIGEVLAKCDSPRSGGTDRGDGNVYDQIATAASWHGDDETMEHCMQTCPRLHSVDLAKACIEAAVRSHNRDRDFANYRRLIELNLEFLIAAGVAIGGRFLHVIAEDFLEQECYGMSADMPTEDQMCELARMMIDRGANVDERDPATGHTPLSRAVGVGHLELARRLLSEGASWQDEDPPETNPAAIARRLGFREILSMR